MSVTAVTPRAVVFVEATVTAAVPYETARSRLAADPLAVTTGALARAHRHDEQLSGRIGPRKWPPLFAKEVTVRASTPRHHGEGTVVSLRWEAAGAKGLFPDFDADLEICPEGELTTRVVLRGSYRPPMGGVGQAMDDLVLHKLAQATVEHVVEAIAAALVRAC